MTRYDFIVCITLLFHLYYPTILASNPSLAATRTTSDGLMHVSVSGSRIFVNDRPYFIRGVNYSPTPIGQSPTRNWPYGDYMSWEFMDLWERDFPLLKALGANTIRVYGWNNNIDHGLFLDTANRHGLKVIITFNIGNTWQNPIQEEWQRQGLLGTFMWQFKKYLNHPAILGWSFGSEVNGAWNNYLGGISQAYGCNWNGGAYPWDPNGCYGNDKGDGACIQPIACVYTHLFQFLNQAAQYAKAAMGDKRRHLILISFADADAILFRLQRFEQFAPDVDAWGMQLYRGRDFGHDSNDFLASFGTSSTKPLIVTEYGVDAYNDPCGTSEKTPCYNTADNPPSGYGEDEGQQADWNFDLTQLLLNHSSADGSGHVAGGFIMGYVDENWKTSVGVVGCHGPIPYGMPGFDASLCDWKAHVTCPAGDVYHPQLCGWYTPATFDQYANVGWFGLMRPSPSSNGDIDRMTPRQTFAAIQRLWVGPTSPVWIWISLAVLAMACVVMLLVFFRYRTKQEAVMEKMGYPAATTRSTYGTTSARSHPVKKPSLNAAPHMSTAAISHMFGPTNEEPQEGQDGHSPATSEPQLPPTSIPPTITVAPRTTERTPLIPKSQ